ncbi:MAG: GDP-mannose 4,6-dehydratase [Acholeplasmatales bacterium]|nr:GDP-mannose 4,6-dehydratase [Acholeplasmatales bacterium]
MILFLKPYFEKKPWAGDKLNKIYDCPEGTGEAWVISGYNKKSSIIKNGKYKGETLRHVWMKHPELFKGIDDKEFPLLVKIIDAKRDLSVQVHPNDNYALEHHNSLGKFECWYFLNQNEATSCIAGIDANKQLDVKEAIVNNTLMTKLMKRDIQNGDLVVIEPGTVHALQAGSLVLEVQESSDITYRLYDYGSDRELHIEDSLNVIKYNDNRNPIYPFQTSDTFDSKYFKISKVFTDGYFETINEQFLLSYCIDGELEINGTQIKKGDTFIICSDEKEIKIKGKGRGLLIEPKPKEEGRAKMRKIALITGIVTQDGSYLTEFLLNKNYEVHGLITSKSQLKSEKIKHLVGNEDIYNKNLFFHLGDLTDTSSLNRLIENVRPDEIYNLASQSHVDVSFELPEYTAQVNSLGTLRLLDAIKQSDLRTKLFNESTSQLYGGNNVDSIQNEETPFNPLNPYATSKLYSHFIVKNYRENYGIYAVNGIMFNHTSQRDDEDFIIRKVTKSVAQISLRKMNKMYVGNIESSRDWGYSKDFVEAMWLSLQQDNPTDYVLATGESHTVKELIEEAFKVIGIRITWVGEGINLKGINDVTGNVLVEVDSKLFRTSDNKFLKGDFSKAKTILGWEPKYKFSDIVKYMVKEELKNK